MNVECKKKIKKELSMYRNYAYPSFKEYLIAKITRSSVYGISRWQYYSRLYDYYNSKKRTNLFSDFLKLYFLRKCHIWAARYGLEMPTHNIGEGLLVYHGNNVVNGYSIIGKNLHLHGNNCIGNLGPQSPDLVPTIGDNVMLGVGAKVLGPIVLADNIKVAAGAVVINSFEEPGITIAGIPAKKVNKKV